MICTFFGHKKLYCDVKHILIDKILYIINTKNVSKFYVGNNGAFDYAVQEALETIISNGVNIKYNIILSTLNEKALNGKQSNTLYPEGLEKSLPRFAIYNRNIWLINNSNYVIAYVADKYSNSYKWIQRAKNKGLIVDNLYLQ